MNNYHMDQHIEFSFKIHCTNSTLKSSNILPDMCKTFNVMFPTLWNVKRTNRPTWSRLSKLALGAVDQRKTVVVQIPRLQLWNKNPSSPTWSRLSKLAIGAIDKKYTEFLLCRVSMSNGLLTYHLDLKSWQHFL